MFRLISEYETGNGIKSIPAHAGNVTMKNYKNCKINWSVDS